MWKRINLDERQLKIRGDIFRHGFIFVMALLFINAYLSFKGIVWAEGMWQNIIIAMIPATACLIEKLLKDILTEERNAFGRIPYLFGFASIIGLIFTIREISSGQSLIIGGTLTELGVYIILNCLFALIFFVFIGKKIYSRTSNKNE